MQSNPENKKKVELPKILSINNEPRLIERIYEGDNRAFSTLYEKYRPKFFGYFQTSFSGAEKNEQIADLYQNSCLKLYNQIITGKMFVQDKNIYIRNRAGIVNVLSAKLETYLIGIGKYSFLEMKRGERKYVDFDPFEKVLSIDDFGYDPAYSFTSLTSPIESSEIKTNPLLEITDDPYFEDEAKFTLVREIVDAMGTPCKEIFTYFYFSEDGKKKTLEEIAKIMPNYSSADSVKNQKSRCHKKFKDAYEKALSAQ